ncbi:MAG TPA: hypothetical protein VMF57_19805 [Solirubrobacteraceae bacterium]|nr:hypothetical protein [Solirubrobacteraceae bacterium]
MRTARQGAVALHEALDAEGGTVAGLLAAPGSSANGSLDQPGPAQVAASGPRTRGRELEYEVLLEMILEGYRLHYGDPVVVRPGDDDLALLLGDQLYALGLARLAALGDLDAVAELADVISLAAQAHSASDRELARAVWEAGAASIGWGSSDGHRLAKDLARSLEPGANRALVAAAAALRDGVA